MFVAVNPQNLFFSCPLTSPHPSGILIAMNETKIQLFLAQLEIPWTEEDLKLVTQGIDDFFRWDGDSFTESIDAAFDAAVDAGRGDDVYSLWLTARELAASNLPEGTDPQTAKDVDSFVGAKAIELATVDLTDNVSWKYTYSHAQFLDGPWNSVFGYTIE
jgi:hypothetical protein